MDKKVIVVTGPTASGKTSLAIEVALKLNTEIISADSRQIFKLLDIGTAKPDKEQLKKVKHHCIDILYPNEEYDVSLFESDARKIMDELFTNGKIPVVVGGSGLYIKAVVDGIFSGPTKDEEFRAKMDQLKATHGEEALHAILQEKDPVSAGKMLPGNWKRVVRALEVLHITGVPIWKHHEEQTTQNDIQYFQFALDLDRKILYDRIEDRVDSMIELGLEEEVKKVLKMGYSTNLNSLNTVGYKEMINYICNDYNLDRCIELIKRNTRRYAKRQLTWFRANKDIKWLKHDSNNLQNEIISLVKQ